MKTPQLPELPAGYRWHIVEGVRQNFPYTVTVSLEKRTYGGTWIPLHVRVCLPFRRCVEKAARQVLAETNKEPKISYYYGGNK